MSTGVLSAKEINNVIVFLDNYGLRLYEAVYSSEADGYLPQELSVLNEHLFAAGVVRWAYQGTPHNVIWCVLSTGKLLAVTYDREQKVFGVAERDTGGFVDDVMVLPGVGYDDVFATVRRVVDGATVGYMELMAPFYRSERHDYPVYYDCAAVKTGVGLTDVTDAGHLEGETVGIWADGVDIGDAVVTAGAFTLPDAIEADTIVYGLRIPFYVQTLKLVQWGQQDGGGPGRQVRVVDGYLSLFETAGLSYGTAEYQDEWTPEVPYNDGEPTPLVNGDVHIGNIDDAWENGGVIALSTDKGYPATIRSITVHAEGTP